MSIKTQIDRLAAAKAAIVAAIKGKGVSVPAAALLDDLDGYVEQIETGADVSGVTAAAGDVTAGKKFVNSAGVLTDGTMPSVTQATPSITVSSAGLITASATQSAGKVAAGTKSATKQLTTQGAKTWTPGTTDQTIAAQRWLSGAQTIKGDANLVAANILKGKSIFGIVGALSAAVDGKGTVFGRKFESGSFTMASASQSSGDISHSMGVKPSGLFMWAEEYKSPGNGYYGIFSVAIWLFDSSYNGFHFRFANDSSFNKLGVKYNSISYNYYTNPWQLMDYSTTSKWRYTTKGVSSGENKLYFMPTTYKYILIGGY